VIVRFLPLHLLSSRLEKLTKNLPELQKHSIYTGILTPNCRASFPPAHLNHLHLDPFGTDGKYDYFEQFLPGSANG